MIRITVQIMRHRYDPWREMSRRDAILEDHDDSDIHGWATFSRPPRISLHRRLTQAQRRSTLTHELVHLERGPLAGIDVLDAREETAVEREAARRLISVEQLARALRWSRNRHEIAEELWVDVDMVHARVDGLTDTERAAVTAAVERIEETA